MNARLGERGDRAPRLQRLRPYFALIRRHWRLKSTRARLARSPLARTVSDATDYSIFVVRREGGRGGEVLRLGVQGLENYPDHALHGGGAVRDEGAGDDGGLRAGWRAVRRFER